MRQHAIMLVAVALAAPRAAGAQAITLDDVIESVDARFPGLRAARREPAIAAGEALSLRGAFDPTWRTRYLGVPVGYYDTHRLDTTIEMPTPWWGASFFAGYRLGLGDFAVYDGKAETNRFGEIRAGASLPLWRNGPIDRRRASVQRAEIGREIADLGVAQQRIEMIRLASLRYWDWVAAGRRAAIARTLVSVAVARDAIVRARAERGDVATIERTENARAIVQRESQLVSAERAVQQAAIELSIYLRDEGGEPLVPDEARLPVDLPDPAVIDRGVAGEEERRAQERRPEPKRLARTRAQGEVELRFAKNQLAPGIDVSVAASYDFDDGTKSPRGFELEAGVVLDVPLRYRTQRGRIDAAEAGIRRADEQERLARDRVAADVRDAGSALDAARQRVLVSRREVELSRELERAERRKFDLGDSTLLFVNLREQAAFEAEVRVIDALADWHRAHASWRAARGVDGEAVRTP